MASGAQTADPTCRFCDTCGSILPLPNCANQSVVCVVCKTRSAVKAVRSRVIFTKEELYYRPKPSTESTTGNADGPEVDRICSKCDNPTMCYSTRQTRSADEGQTVFFTCPKCAYKEIEYS